MNPQEQAGEDAKSGRFRLEVVVVPRPGLLDPQGKAIQQALAALGYDGVEAVRHGKAIFLDVRADSAEAARAQARAMCRKLLANPVTEDFEIRASGKAPDERRTSAGNGSPSRQSTHCAPEAPDERRTSAGNSRPADRGDP